MKAHSWHPAAELFPMMEGADFDLLVEDIRQHGLIEAIVLLDGAVLDGRNRLRACERAGVEPRFVEWQDGEVSPTEYVVAKNLHRRHLTTAQRATLALDLLPRLEAEAKERQNATLRKGDQSPVSPAIDERGRSDEKAAELVGVGRSTVAAAKGIAARDETGEVIADMRAGKINVAEAAREVGYENSYGAKPVLEAEDRDALGRAQPVAYGKGDKWTEASEPLRRYLAAWNNRNYAFRHVNPREAAKRVRVIDELLLGLTLARADLSTRDTVARIRS